MVVMSPEDERITRKGAKTAAKTMETPIRTTTTRITASYVANQAMLRLIVGKMTEMPQKDHQGTRQPKTGAIVKPIARMMHPISLRSR